MRPIVLLFSLSLAAPAFADETKNLNDRDRQASTIKGDNVPKPQDRGIIWVDAKGFD